MKYARGARGSPDEGVLGGPLIRYLGSVCDATFVTDAPKPETLRHIVDRCSDKFIELLSQDEELAASYEALQAGGDPHAAAEEVLRTRRRPPRDALARAHRLVRGPRLAIVRSGLVRSDLKIARMRDQSVKRPALNRLRILQGHRVFRLVGVCRSV
jgi:hypothetical protein